MSDSQSFQDGYKEGKTQSIEVLERVLTSMKSTNDTPTNVIFNLIFDEVLEKVLAELI